MNKMNLVAPINKLSYGYVSVNILKALTDLGVNVSLFPINKTDIEFEKHHQSYVVQALNNSKNADKKAPTLKSMGLFLF
jgi:hypothetical protein